MAELVLFSDPTGKTVEVSAANPLPVTGGGGCGGDVNIHDSSGANITNGQQTMANSVPVVIASNQTAIPVTVATGEFQSLAAATTASGTVAATNGAGGVQIVAANV